MFLLLVRVILLVSARRSVVIVSVWWNRALEHRHIPRFTSGCSNCHAPVEMEEKVGLHDWVDVWICGDVALVCVFYNPPPHCSALVILSDMMT